MSHNQAAGYLGGLFLLLLVMSGCATAPQTRALLSDRGSIPLPRQVELDQVPFYPQQRYQCGPAALATLLNWSNVPVTPEQLVPEVYVPERKGSFQLELMASTRRHQRLAYPIAPRLHDLLVEIAAGNPVLVLQNLGLDWLPTWHFAVVVGYDLDAQVVILRSGTYRRMTRSLTTFERTWARGNYWALRVLKPDELPAIAEQDTYLKAAVALEQVQHWHAANRAYHTALSVWPDSLLAQLGLGNSAYQLGDKPAAAAAFGQAVNDHPHSGIAHNNLAQVLLELGDYAAARQHAVQAITLGGPYHEEFEATLNAIDAANSP